MISSPLKQATLLVILSVFFFLTWCREEYDDYYEEYSDYDRDSGYGADETGGINPLAAFIAPLAGLALLGAAAAVSINPVLVQLAVINDGKRRKKRSSDPDFRRKMT